jgi:hypothetical protein
MRRQVGMRAWSLAALALAILAGSEIADSAVAQAVPSQALPTVECTTTGSTTYCKDGTQFEANTASTPGGAAAADGKPARQALGKSGPIEYQRDNLRIFGVDDRIRRLGETNYKTGQQNTIDTYSGRNCARFQTSVVCD